jgi:flagellar basal-body rod protein FlgG
MSNGLYAAASALDAYRQREEAITQNLANVETTGYKRQLVAFRPFGDTLAEAARGVGLVGTETATDYTQGDLVSTGAPLDLALEGKGFYAVGAPEGLRYTRAGTFTKNAAGQLSTNDGDPVLGTSGPIALGDTPLADLRVDAKGRITSPQGEVGAIRLVGFETEPPPLVAEGRGLYRPVDGAEETTPGATVVRQGFRERSNTEPVSELLALIEVHRSFEASTKTIDAIGTTLQKTTELK